MAEYLTYEPIPPKAIIPELTTSQAPIVSSTPDSPTPSNPIPNLNPDLNPNPNPNPNLNPDLTRFQSLVPKEDLQAAFKDFQEFTGLLRQFFDSLPEVVDDPKNQEKALQALEAHFKEQVQLLIIAFRTAEELGKRFTQEGLEVHLIDYAGVILIFSMQNQDWAKKRGIYDMDIIVRKNVEETYEWIRSVGLTPKPLDEDKKEKIW